MDPNLDAMKLAKKTSGDSDPNQNFSKMFHIHCIGYRGSVYLRTIQLFLSVAFERQRKISIFIRFFCFLLTVHLNSSKKQDITIHRAGPVQIITNSDPRGPKTYGSYGSGSGTLVF